MDGNFPCSRLNKINQTVLQTKHSHFLDRSVVKKAVNNYVVDKDKHTCHFVAGDSLRKENKKGSKFDGYAETGIGGYSIN